MKILYRDLENEAVWFELDGNKYWVYVFESDRKQFTRSVEHFFGEGEKEMERVIPELQELNNSELTHVLSLYDAITCYGSLTNEIILNYFPHEFDIHPELYEAVTIQEKEIEDIKVLGTTKEDLQKALKVMESLHNEAMQMKIKAIIYKYF